MNKRKVTEQILNLISTAEDAVQLKQEPYFQRNAEHFKQNLTIVGTAFSGSWLGYHASVYYDGFSKPTPGDGFNTEWGLKLPYGRRRPSGWREMTYDQVRSALMNGVDPDYERRLDQISQKARTAFDEAHSSMTTLLAVLLENKATAMVDEIQKEVAEIKGFVGPSEIIHYMRPKGSIMSRDSTAVSQGFRTPPHAALEAWHISQLSPFNALSRLTKEANKLLKYMEMHDLLEHKTVSQGTRVFIGHGRSSVWRELKDFVNDRLRLEWDEFNREPTAGLATKERLKMMLDQACFALLVMTAEDQHTDETLHARENVIHEVGLFQGRLGFRRAVVLLEEGCSEFSNITGLSQIRFPASNIGAAFEEIRRVLEREGIIKE